MSGPNMATTGALYISVINASKENKDLRSLVVVVIIGYFKTLLKSIKIGFPYSYNVHGVSSGVK